MWYGESLAFRRLGVSGFEGDNDRRTGMVLFIPLARLDRFVSYFGRQWAFNVLARPRIGGRWLRQTMLI